MKIALIQMKTVAYEPLLNRETAFRLMTEAAPKADVLVLPELWPIGYGLSTLQEEAVTYESELVTQLAAFAKEKQVNVVAGSVPFREGEKIFNRSLCFDREGCLVDEYDKVHRFSLLDEPKFFTAGRKRTTVNVDGVTCGLSICYDLRFPELYRALTLDGAKIIFVPAQWPESRKLPWLRLNQARAIENQVYICAVNGVGTYKDNVFCGNSLFIAPDGEILAQGDGGERILYGTYDEQRLRDVRAHMSVWEDRRPDVYGDLPKLIP